jgi:hypothetical protein
MIKQVIGLLLVSFSLFLFTGCPYNNYRYEMGHFPYDPVNFAEVNSEFDDYNSTAPFIESGRYLYFSSNRNSNGGEFDIVGDNLRIFWDKDEGKLTVDDRPTVMDYRYTDRLYARINTPFNELGPFSMPYMDYAAYPYHYTDLVIFANDESGNLDLKFAWFEGQGENPSASDGECFGPDAISFLNTEYNDAYLTCYGPGYFFYDYYAWDPSLITELLFCSDRSGNFDIYKVQKPEGSSLIDFLSQDTPEATFPVAVLNSSYDDKCPYTNGEMLVFTSNRPGGFGGFDIYYSRRTGDTWSEPLNAGSRINTEYDEYRPILISHYEFQNDMMIFSSNRPGGKGGYDLYYVGMPRSTFYYLE